MKYYNEKSSSDTDLSIDDPRSSLLGPGGRNRTSSRTSILKQGSVNSIAYNEYADTTDVRHINFLSDIVARLWPYLNEAGTTMVREMIEPTFKETLPGPLSTLRFRKLDLGNVPLVLDNILVRELRTSEDGMASGKNRDYIQFEWDVTWNSTCDIQLATDTFGISFGVKGITLSGRLQVIATPLSGVLPCIDAVQFAFVNPPEVELDFTGLANVADLKGIKGKVRKIVDNALAQSLVLPKRTVAPLVDKVDYRDIFCPAFRGLARLRLHSGRGFEIQKASTRFGKDDIPDVYLMIRLGAEEFFESNVVKDNCNPEWDPDVEVHDFLYCCRDQILEMQAWDSDSGPLDSDDLLGVAYTTIGEVMLGSDRNGKFEVQLMDRAKKSGKNDTPTEQYITISLETLSFTTKNLSSLRVENADVKPEKEGKESKDGKRVIGLTRVLISHATDLPFAKEEDANTFVKLWSGTGPDRVEIGVTPTVPSSLNPAYQTPFSIPLTVSGVAKATANNSLGNFTMEMFQQDPSGGKPKSLGEIVIDNQEFDHEEFSLRESRSIGENNNTKLAFSISVSGVSESLQKSRLSSLEEETSESDDSGMLDALSKVAENKIRVRIVEGYGFESEQKARFRKADIPDVYCKVKFGSSPSTWRTETIKDSENPKWLNETHDYVMESANQVISIDVWDANRNADDYYGNARTSVGKVLMNGGRLDVEVKNDKSSKGTKTMKKMMSGMGISGGGGVVRGTGAKMFITVECVKL